jgi:hypothetical protein
MNASTINSDSVKKAILVLFDEAYAGAPDPKAGTWFTDNEPGSGFLGSIADLSAAEASRPLTPGEPLTIASHVDHLRFSLDLANRTIRGENAFAGADWADSWRVRTVDEEAWRKLVAAFRSEYDKVREAIETAPLPDDPVALTGTLSLFAHGAWHLGAIRQGLGLVRAPKE